MDLKILYENKDLVICVKPCLVPSQPDPSGDEDMTSVLDEHFRTRGEGRSAAFVVHRLDRCVGGVMVYAKNKETCSYLSGIVADKDRFTKEYIAVVSGTPTPPSGRFEDILYKDSAQGKAFVAGRERKGAKRAVLDYEVVDTREPEGLSLVKIRLGTGRFHQIRVQFASRKMPIFGDGKYGSRKKSEGIALWSYRLGFEYKGETYSFSCLPDGAQGAWGLFDLKKYCKKTLDNKKTL